MPRPSISLLALISFVAVLYLLVRPASQPAVPPINASDRLDEPLTPATFYTKIPYTSSWASWWHPQRFQGSSTSAIRHGWNILYHLGGNGPWIEKIDGVVKGGIAPPKGCTVEQVHMMSRHAERFPTIKAGARMIALVDRIHASKVKLKGELEFANDWQYFTQEPDKHLEQLTTTGPFAGTLEAFTTGVKLRTRYSHLLPDNAPGTKTQLWASDSKRVVDTAHYFSAGLFGIDWRETATVNVIPETSDLGADTLTPGDTCFKYRDDQERGHDFGAIMLAKFRETYLGGIAKRLRKTNPEFTFQNDEIYSMQEMCGFETLVRGSSKWCDVFDQEDWKNFEYARDVIHYYRAGPGNPYGPAMGWLWLNATANLLAKGPASGLLYFSFVHDGDIVPMLAASGLFPDADDLPVTHVARGRTWRTSQVTPMGGRVIFERLVCPSSPSSSSPSAKDHQAEGDVYVRINVNDGIVAHPACASGPGRSCPLGEFLRLVRARGEQAGDFRTVCGLGEDAPARITFLHQ